MIDLNAEKAITFDEAANLVPGRNADRPLNVNTLWRWSRRGLRGVRLETLKIGGMPVTTREALHRFFAAVTRASNRDSSADARANADKQNPARRSQERRQTAAVG